MEVLIESPISLTESAIKEIKHIITEKIFLPNMAYVLALKVADAAACRMFWDLIYKRKTIIYISLATLIL